MFPLVKWLLPSLTCSQSICNSFLQCSLSPLQNGKVEAEIYEAVVSHVSCGLVIVLTAPVAFS